MSRYFRLMALAGVELMCTTPLAIFQMALNATAQPLDPWVSWSDTHYNFSRVRLVPAVIWRTNHLFVMGIQLNRWSGPFCALIFFGFFGFATEARKHYWNAITRVLVICRLKRDPSFSPKTPPRSVFCAIPVPLRLLCYLVSGSLLLRLPPRHLLNSLYTHPLLPATNPQTQRQPPSPPTTRASCLSPLLEPFQNSPYPLTKNPWSRNLQHRVCPLGHSHHEPRRHRSLTTPFDLLIALTTRFLVSLFLFIFTFTTSA